MITRTYLPGAWRICLIAMACMLYFSCKKDDAVNTRELYIYTPSGTVAYNVSADTISLLRDEKISGGALSFPVMLTRAFEKDVQVTAVIDTALLSAYDSINTTAVPRFGTGTFKLAKETVTVRQGATVSADSIQLILTDTTGLDLSKVYIVPVLLTPTAQHIPVSSTRQALYLKVSLLKVSSSVTAGLITQVSAFTPAIKAGPVVGFPVSVNKILGKNIAVTAVDDVSLVANYNTANNTGYATLPAGSYTLTKNTATVIAGAARSADSIKVEFPDLTLLTPGTSYLLPVKIKDEGAASPAATNNTKYILFTPRLAAVSIPASGSNVIDVKFTRPVNGGDVTGPALTGFGAALNATLSGAIQVGIAHDASLVSSYNTTNGTSFKAFPAGSFSISKDNVVVAAGATTSAADSFRIQFSNYNALVAGETYLLPLVIKEGGAAEATANKTVYVRVPVIPQNIDPSNSGLTGSTMSRTGWVATASSTSSNTYNASRAIDGSSTTMWRASGVPQWWQVNMGVAKTVKGFNINTGISGSTRYGDILEMEVLSGDDGVNWTSQGIFTSSASDTKMVKFTNPVTARYFRFNVTKTANTSFSAIGELNGVE